MELRTRKTVFIAPATPTTKPLPLQTFGDEAEVTDSWLEKGPSCVDIDAVCRFWRLYVWL